MTARGLLLTALHSSEYSAVKARLHAACVVCVSTGADVKEQGPCLLQLPD